MKRYKNNNNDNDDDDNNNNTKGPQLERGKKCDQG